MAVDEWQKRCADLEFALRYLMQKIERERAAREDFGRAQGPIHVPTAGAGLRHAIHMTDGAREVALDLLTPTKRAEP